MGITREPGERKEKEWNATVSKGRGISRKKILQFQYYHHRMLFITGHHFAILNKVIEFDYADWLCAAVKVSAAMAEPTYDVCILAFETFIIRTYLLPSSDCLEIWSRLERETREKLFYIHVYSILRYIVSKACIISDNISERQWDTRNTNTQSAQTHYTRIKPFNKD